MPATPPPCKLPTRIQVGVAACAFAEKYSPTKADAGLVPPQQVPSPLRPLPASELPTNMLLLLVGSMMILLMDVPTKAWPLPPFVRDSNGPSMMGVAVSAFLTR
jgi:hypothetical protein